MERQLFAIMAVDLAGYSRFMHRDEAGTFARLQSNLNQVILPAISAHDGEVIKLIGDGVLAQFVSVIGAVKAAVKIQKQLADHCPDTDDDDLWRYRIGIHLGDVIVSQQDIFGDGVNLAARVEGLAPPGGICITRAVRDQVRDRLSYYLQDAGQVSVKNVDRPLRVFRVVFDAAEAAQLRGHDRARLRRRVGPVVAATLAGALVLTSPALIDVVAPPATPPLPTTNEPLPDYAVRADTGLLQVRASANLRRGPGLDYPRMGNAAAGDTLRLTGTARRDGAIWYRVVLSDDAPPNRASFIHGDLVVPFQGPALAIQEDAAPLFEVTPVVAVPQEPESEPEVAPLQPTWVQVGLDVSGSLYNDCRHYLSDPIPLTASNGGWTAVPFSQGPEFSVRARLRGEGERPVIDVWPYATEWPVDDGVSIHLAAGSPGAGGRAFTGKGAPAPLHFCGRAVIYVQVVEEPETP
ncbi:MAG: adenylate/guanylate cyclase domain-containing protein [Pseudomonadota bacterium]